MDSYIMGNLFAIHSIYPSILHPVQKAPDPDLAQQVPWMSPTKQNVVYRKQNAFDKQLIFRFEHTHTLIQ